MVMAGSIKPSAAKESPPANVEENSLVRRFVRGETEAFDQIVALHQQRITNLAYRLLGWPDDIEDVVQEVFLSVYKNLKNFRGSCRLETWLTTITVNTCRTYRRKRMLRMKLLTKTDTLPQPAAPNPADSPALDREKFAQVRQAVLKLPPRYREVVVLRYLQDLPITEIAAVLGLSRNAIDVRLNRARDRLKQILAHLVEQ
jgi:RNA polymerase sigma-70 factor (ECF subfamily)